MLFMLCTCACSIPMIVHENCVIIFVSRVLMIIVSRVLLLVSCTYVQIEQLAACVGLTK